MCTKFDIYVFIASIIMSNVSVMRKSEILLTWREKQQPINPQKRVKLCAIVFFSWLSSGVTYKASYKTCVI